jgi:flagellar biosynthesis/type III secretory pathway ATPase
VRGTNPQLDQAIALHPEIDKFLIQAVDEKNGLPETLAKVASLAGALK